MQKSQLAKVLREAVIDPKKDTAYRFVVELNSQMYCITKARDILNTLDPTKKISTESVKQSITLLAMALCMMEAPKKIKAGGRPLPEGVNPTFITQPSEAPKRVRNNTRKASVSSKSKNSEHGNLQELE